MKSSIHLNYVNLFWLYLFMKTIYMYIRNPKSIKPKTKHIELVCVCVCEPEHINTIYLYTRSKYKLKLNKPKSFCRTSSSRRLDPNTIQRAWLQPSARCDLDARALESHVFAPKTHLLKLITYNILIKYLRLIKHKIISTITTWVNHYQN